MKIKFILCLVLILIGCSRVQSAENATEREIRQLAQTSSHFSLTVMIKNRPLFPADSPQFESLAKEQLRLLKQLRTLSGDVESLKVLLTNSNPKIRTLALGALFQRENGRELPLIASLINDSAPTFPDLYNAATQQGGPRPMEEQEGPQTVGSIAQMMLAFWRVEHNGWSALPARGGSGVLTSNDFAVYWQKHKDRDYCAGWFAVKLARAGRNTDPTPKEYVPDIRKLRAQINRLPADDRTWTLLWLYGEYGSDALTDEKELVQLSRQLGPERLMLMLQRKIPTSDPDLHTGEFDDWPFNRMRTFVFNHAAELLRPEDADVLLAAETHEENLSSPFRLIAPGWAIAAAHLQPQRAGEILHAAFNHFDGKDEYHAEMRADITVALWQLRGEAEAKFLADWFYQEVPSTQLWVNWRRNFIENVSKVNRPNSKKLFATLLLDARYEQIHWDVASLQSLANVVNSWLGKPPVPQDDIDKIRMDENSPLKMQLLDSLRASMPRWNKP